MAKILVVDDEVAITELLSSFLTSELGHQVTILNTGVEVLPTIQHDRPDVVLLDIMIGKDSGVEVLKQIHAYDPTIKVLMVTGTSSDEKTVQQTKALGALAFITKPFNLIALGETIKKIL